MDTIDEYTIRKPKCEDCEGYHVESYDCVAYWRETATLYFRRWEVCTSDLKESGIWRKAQKQMYGVTFDAGS